jgi:Kef-type K+ transport system membrane component KefB
LKSPEGQIILGAAVIDDVFGLLILTIVAGLSQGRDVSLFVIIRTAASALAFLVAAIVIGKLVVPRAFGLAGRIELPGTATAMALTAAFGMAWLADRWGSGMVIGAFAAGLVVVAAPQAHEIERGITELGHFFVPLFFITVGASVDLRALDPLQADSRFALVIGTVLILAGTVGKLAAGYAPFWFRGNKMVVGVGMVPRGEVGLIFAQTGLAAGVFDAGLFGGVTLMVIVTTFLAPPLLKRLLGPPMQDKRPEYTPAIDELVSEA